MAKHLFTNRLITEKSPYLLQHAHNPVDWFPWGEEAFALAREWDKPIFLSIGYATCHWCHVMEIESFEDAEIAKLLNDTFVNIKVDREELPEVDSLYMEFAQSIMAGAAGWPLQVILTPNLEPFFATTYLPPFSREGTMGMIDLILKIRELWSGVERERVRLQASHIVETFKENMRSKGEKLPDSLHIQDTAETLFKIADPIYGGIKGAPKFPLGYQSSFLLRYFITHQDTRALFLVEKTLDMMQRGGIYDHLGGGFARYSVDEEWLVPHFEKMLYDNAILSQTYLEAWKMTKRPLYRQICEKMIHYLLNEMTNEEGGFFSAEDADSEDGEGYYYTWTKEEIEDILGVEEAQLFCEFYGVTIEGNFEGRNILHTKLSIEEFSQAKSYTPQILSARFAQEKERLLKARSMRMRPLKDDKILSGWNGLMIHSLAEAASDIAKQKYLDAAKNAACFIQKYLWNDGVLYRRWRQGETRYEACFDDYAYLIRGLLTLYEVDGNTSWLEWVVEMTELLAVEFKEEGGAYYQLNQVSKRLPIRKCYLSDGAEPSGNAIHAENLLRLYELSHDPIYRQHAADILKTVQPFIESYSLGYCYHLIALQRFIELKPLSIVIALNKKLEHGEEIRKLLFQKFLPHKMVIWRREDDQKLFDLLPFTKKYSPLDGRTTLYICSNGKCEAPISDLPSMIEAVRQL